MKKGAVDAAQAHHLQRPGKLWRTHRNRNAGRESYNLELAVYVRTKFLGTGTWLEPLRSVRSIYQRSSSREFGVEPRSFRGLSRRQKQTTVLWPSMLKPPTRSLSRKSSDVTIRTKPSQRGLRLNTGAVRTVEQSPRRAWTLVFSISDASILAASQKRLWKLRKSCHTTYATSWMLEWTEDKTSWISEKVHVERKFLCTKFSDDIEVKMMLLYLCLPISCRRSSLPLSMHEIDL